MTYHFKKTATGMMVLLVNIKVSVELVDTGCKKGNLNLRRTGVAFVNGKVLDNLVLNISCQNNSLLLKYLSAIVRARGRELSVKRQSPKAQNTVT